MPNPCTQTPVSPLNARKPFLTRKVGRSETPILNPESPNRFGYRGRRLRLSGQAPEALGILLRATLNPESPLALGISLR